MLVYKKWKSVGRFFFQPNSHSLGCFFVSPQASSEVRIQDGAHLIKLQVRLDFRRSLVSLVCVPPREGRNAGSIPEQQLVIEPSCR